MQLHSFLTGVAFIAASIQSTLAGSAETVVVTKTVKQLVFTCPCDDSKSTSYLDSWSSWGGAAVGKDDSGSGYTGIKSTGDTFNGGKPTGKPINGGPFDGDSAFSICYTGIATKVNYSPSTSIKTHYTTCATPVTTTTTVTTTSTTTPTPTTTTFTISVTTTSIGNPTTSTITSTETTTTITTLTETDTETDTETATTTSTSTSTIPSSANFTPIDTTLPGASQAAKKKKRDSPGSGSYSESYNGGFSGLKAMGIPDNASAGDVTCHYYTTSCSTSTVTATTTSTSVSTASTPIVTTSITTTITIISIPGVSTATTTTVTSTSSATTTTTTTTVTTSTETATATASFYAACDPNTNQASYVNGAPIVGGTVDGGNNQVVNGATDAYDCCVAAILDPLGAVWGLALSDSGNTCVIVESPNACPNGQSPQPPNTADVSSAAPTAGFVLGNANCQQWNVVDGS